MFWECDTAETTEGKEGKEGKEDKEEKEEKEEKGWGGSDTNACHRDQVLRAKESHGHPRPLEVANLNGLGEFKMGVWRRHASQPE